MIKAILATYLSFHLALLGAFVFLYLEEIKKDWETEFEPAWYVLFCAVFGPYIFLYRLND